MIGENYTAEPIKAAIVEREGDYQLKVTEVTMGKTKDNLQYYRIKCLINATGFPEVSVFLTEGLKFNSNATAFFDTFDIERGNFDTNSWIGHKGYMHIQLKQGEKYMNMIPLYILDDNGWVKKASGSNQSFQPTERAGNYTKSESSSSGNIPDEIPF